MYQMLLNEKTHLIGSSRSFLSYRQLLKIGETCSFSPKRQTKTSLHTIKSLTQYSSVGNNLGSTKIFKEKNRY